MRHAAEIRTSEIRASGATRLRRFHDLLDAAYGPQHWWPAETPFEVVLGAYLTQNTSWKAVERSLERLRQAGVFTVEAVRATPVARLRELIAPSGFATRKAPAILAFVALLDREYSGSFATMAEAPTAGLRNQLLTLPGVGPETADAILLYALGHPVPVADEYLRRIVERHDLLAHQTNQPRSAIRIPATTRIPYDAMATLMREAFTDDPAARRAALFNQFHALAVAVGKTHCGRVARCEGCPLAGELGQRQLR